MKDAVKTVSSREGFVDLMKFFAIMFVLLYHGTMYPWNVARGGGLEVYLNFFLRTILATCVPLFFFVNGYLLFKKELNLDKHVSKLVHFTAICFLWAFIKIGVTMVAKGQILSAAQVWDIISTWKVGWINTLWFLGALVCVYVFYPLLKLAYDHNRKIFNYFVMACGICTIANFSLAVLGIIGANAVGIKMPFAHYNPLTIFNPFRGGHGYAFFYFCLGAYVPEINRYLDQYPVQKQKLMAWMAMLVSCLGIFLLGIGLAKTTGRIVDMVWNGYALIFTVVNVLCIYALCRDYNRDYGIIKLISANTLGIYLIHMFFIQGTRPMLMKLPALQNFPATLVYAALLALASLAVVKVLKLIPGMKNYV